MFDRELKHLHPKFRERVIDLQNRFSQENLPFQLFEGFRSPERQQYLYSQGRTRPGNIVTRATSWQSNHQYGIAADFVLFENGQWSWDDKGVKNIWWNRLQELGRGVGLNHLGWDKPHLEMKDITISDLLNGKYPSGGDTSWAENLTSSIYSWNGLPSAPPIPSEVIVDRPPLNIAGRTAIVNTPPVGCAGWRSQFGGQEWRYDERGVYIHSYANGNEPLRTRGEPITCRKVMELCGQQILASSIKYEVPVPLIIMVIATETGFARKCGFTGYSTFRWEPHVKVNDVSPNTFGDYSAGPMQTLATTARWIVRVQNLSYSPFEVAPY